MHKDGFRTFARQLGCTYTQYKVIRKQGWYEHCLVVVDIDGVNPASIANCDISMSGGQSFGKSNFGKTSL